MKLSAWGLLLAENEESILAGLNWSSLDVQERARDDPCAQNMGEEGWDRGAGEYSSSFREEDRKKEDVLLKIKMSPPSLG